MALQGWDKNYREELKIQQEVIESLQRQLMIGGGREPNEEDAPYRPAPIPNPGQPPWPGYPNPPKLANAGDLMIQGLPRGGYYGNSHRPARQSGELTNAELIKTLKIAAPLLRGV